MDTASELDPGAGERVGPAPSPDVDGLVRIADPEEGRLRAAEPTEKEEPPERLAVLHLVDDHVARRRHSREPVEPRAGREELRSVLDEIVVVHRVSGALVLRVEEREPREVVAHRRGRPR